MKTFSNTEATGLVTRLRDQLTRMVPEPGNHDGILRLSTGIDPVCPLDWLCHEKRHLRFYGSTRDPLQAIEIGGLDAVKICVWEDPLPYHSVIDHVQSILALSSDDVRFYGGFRFSRTDAPDELWRPFGYARFVVPRYELIHSKHQTLFSVHFTASEWERGDTDDLLDRIGAMSFAPCAWDDRFPPPVSRSENPDYSGWERNIALALRDFQAGTLEKIVLARKADFRFDGSLDPIVLLHRLEAATPECFHFCYMPSSDLAFLGASPERLYLREGRQLLTEAVAGTRMRSKNPEEDRKLGEALLNSDKDRREHEFVRQGIRATLAPYSKHFKMDEAPRLLKLARGQHLYSGIQATLSPDINDGTLLDALHPTAALGGYPTHVALRRIAELETFDRGWYAAPVGWISRQAAEFAVAIRSGIVRPHELSLFSGAGVVAGSTAESEWDEIELKIRDFIRLLTDT